MSLFPFITINIILKYSYDKMKNTMYIKNWFHNDHIQKHEVATSIMDIHVNVVSLYAAERRSKYMYNSDWKTLWQFRVIEIDSETEWG